MILFLRKVLHVKFYFGMFACSLYIKPSHANTDLFTMSDKRNRIVLSTIPACVSHTVVSNQLLILIPFWWVTPVGTNESFKEWCTTGGGVEWLLKSLLIFLKQAITLPKDFLMFLITYFFSLNINSSAKTISISADIDFSSLRRYNFRHCNLFI